LGVLYLPEIAGYVRRAGRWGGEVHYLRGDGGGELQLGDKQEAPVGGSVIEGLDRQNVVADLQGALEGGEVKIGERRSSGVRAIGGGGGVVGEGRAGGATGVGAGYLDAID